MNQYKLIDNKTDKLIGYVVGKTPNNELVIDYGTHTDTLAIISKTSSLYRVELIVSSTK